MIPSSNIVDDSEIPFLALTSISGKDDAKKLADALIRAKLAACIQIIPQAVSLFEWEGQLKEEQEALLLIKTRKSLLKTLEQKVSTLHPYDTPEFLVFEADGVSEKYLSWLVKNTSS
ncbi:UNVERIFIED_CONTAM: hypothetical protein GTU68_030345 [Idotea baltica]|nr:hypothetical protein [Idotea baltica]